ncbi:MULTISPECIES: MFS transporter [unclassified Luteococcus]|uniref:MFS transporter n=1 Tax=unclassified Luteococcus TaxID=2639923 RepID=UPI00313DC10F
MSHAAPSQTFSSLANPNYRIWFVGGLVSNVGGWMARTAQAWLVLVVLTDGNAQALGYQTALIFLPALLLNPVAGSIADRLPKRTILLVSCAVGLVSAALLSALTITGQVRLWQVFALSLVDGLSMAFDNPARQAFVSEIVDFEQLPNAISLNSASFNAARLLGPGIGGALIALVGTGWVIAANVLAFAAMIVALLRMDTALLHPSKPATGRNAGFVAGLRYVRRRPDLLALLTVGLAVGGLGFNFNITNAVMATQAFHRGAGDYGMIGSFMGVGALVAALWSARRGSPRLRHVLMGMAGYCVFNLFSAVSGTFWLFVLLQVPVGFFTITALVTGNSLLQTATGPQMRGRVMALWGLTIFGMAPMISPLVGWIGNQFGPRATIMFGVVTVGLVTAALIASIMRNDHIRVRLDWHKRAPWMRIERLLSQDVSEVRR